MKKVAFLIISFLLAGSFVYFVITSRSRPLGASSLDKTRSMLESGDVEKINSALQFLAERVPEPALRAEVERLGYHPDPMVRFSAVRVISYYEDRDAAQYLQLFLNDPNKDVVEMAEHGLDNIYLSIDKPDLLPSP